MTFPQATPYVGIDRAQPYTLAELDALPEQTVVGYYLPSPYADVAYSVDEAKDIVGSPRTKLYPLPIYVAAMALVQGDGTKYADEAIALCRVFPNHGVVVLDIEEEAQSATPTAILAIDIQEQVAREFIAEIAERSELVPVVYGSVELYDRMLSNIWVASWLPPNATPVGGPLMPGIEAYNADADVPRPLGWQYFGDDTPPFMVPDRSVWLPFLFTEPDNISQEWADMHKYTTEIGDTLESIATKLYGKAGAVVNQIAAINKRVLRTYAPRTELPEGTVLTVPTPTVSATADEAAAKPADVTVSTGTSAPVPPATAPSTTSSTGSVTPTAPPALPVAPKSTVESRLASLVKDYADELDSKLGDYLSTHKQAIMAAAVSALEKVLEAL